jgi:transcriptional regulator with XRE-family HTH domain
MTADRTHPPGNRFSDETATSGGRLAAAREAAGLARRELAERLGVRAKTISAWEHDQTEPRANCMQMLAGMRNVSLIWLPTGEGEGVSPPDARGNAPRKTVALPAELQEVRSGIGSLNERLGRVDARLGRELACEAA